MPTRSSARHQPMCLQDARAFHEVFGAPARREESRRPAPRPRASALQANGAGETGAGAPAAGLVLVPSYVIESWEPTATTTAEPLVAVTAAAPAPEATPAPPVPPPAAAPMERSVRTGRVVEAGTFRITRAELSADVDVIRSGRTGARDEETDLVNGFLRHMARAEGRPDR